MTVITIYSLFFDDIRIVAFPKSADNVFFGLTLFSFTAYCIEIILAGIAIDGYFNSFFFWLDVVSTITMLPDCGWIWYPIMQQGSALLTTGKTTDIAKTTRSSRVTRIIRIIRLMRLFRIVKLYKQVKAAERQRLQAINEQRSETRILRKKNNILAQHMQKRQNKVIPIIDQGGGTGGVIERQESVDSLDREMQEIDQSVSQPKIMSNNASVEQSNISHMREASQSIQEVSVINASTTDVENTEPEIQIEQSRISKTLTEQTMQAIVLIILSLLFLLPLFTPDTYDG